MTPALLLLVAALLAFAGGLIAAEDRAGWRAAAAWAVVAAALVGWWVAEPRGEVGGEVYAEARTEAGATVATTVVVQRPGASKRQVRRVPLRRTVPGGAAALWAMLALGVLGGVLVNRAAWSAWLPAVGAAAAAVTLSASSGGAGEEGVRAFLAGFDPKHLQSFTVPEQSWTFATPARLPVLVAAVVAVIAVVPWRVPAAERLVGLGAVAATAAPIWQMARAGGVAAAPVDAVCWAGALMLAGAWFLRDAGWRCASLGAAAAVLASAALGG